MSQRPALLPVVLVAVSLLFAVGCQGRDVQRILAARGVTVNAAQADRIADHYRKPPASPMSCHAAVDALWPASTAGWAHRIVNRESRGIPTAQNKVSSAAGCFQMLQLHRARFVKVGCSWARRYEATCNVLAALDLYREQGTRPWRVS